MLEYKTVESGVLPCQIDDTSSPDGVYIRRNIKKIIIENESGENTEKYNYQEAFISKAEFNQVSMELLAAKINGEENTAEFEEYKNKLNTPVEYTNGKFYKPSYSEIYEEKLYKILLILFAYEKFGGDVTKFLNLNINIFGPSDLPQEVEPMGIKDIIELYFFLLVKQEEIYNEYKFKKMSA